MSDYLVSLVSLVTKPLFTVCTCLAHIALDALYLKSWMAGAALLLRQHAVRIDYSVSENPDFHLCSFVFKIFRIFTIILL